ncbi:MAG TPA: alpha-L-fucosidase [Opitutaceae bacterium]|nr:alpha-L-fucosidase [Opitutaceae bacterium]
MTALNPRSSWQARLAGAAFLFAGVSRFAAGAAELPVKLGTIAIAPGPFQPTWESLRQYRCPEWFKDAKFGIWSHWGPQCVPEQGDWYARNLYREGSPHYKHHVATYGHPSEFGYKDIVKLWKAEKFDPDALMAKYVKAGAKYFVSMGVHHDNFDLWNSRHTTWNAVKMGPHRDIVGDWAAAARRHGLRFGVSEHLERTYAWFNTNKGADKTGPKAGVPYDGNDPRFSDFYLTKHDDTREVYPIDPPAWWRQHWYDRVSDLVENYHPDLVYTDGGVPFGGVGRSLIAHFYNLNLARHGGKLEAVYNIKNDPRHQHGEYVDGIAVEDLERAALDGIKAEPWQTCSSVADWFYSKRYRVKTPAWAIHLLADIVSKNGNLLLNFTQHPDGTLAPESELILDELAAWMPVNGEAIFGTRPWRVYGEGPSTIAKGRLVEGRTKYTAEDIRFTTKGDTLYAIVLGWPEGGALVIKSLATGPDETAVGAVRLLGADGDLKTSRDETGLKVELPAEAPTRHAVVLAIQLAK